MTYGYADKDGKISYYTAPLNATSPNSLNGGFLGADSGMGFLGLLSGRANSQKYQNDGYSFYGDNGWLKPVDGLAVNENAFTPVNPMDTINAKYISAPKMNVDPLSFYNQYRASGMQPLDFIGGETPTAQQSGGGNK